jgi:glycosyltransferase involved in cell wall biosynthesis
MKQRAPLLFVGNFLQKHRGSVGTAQKMTKWLHEEDGITFPAVSEYENIFYRLFDIVKTILVKRPNRIFVDTYSGKAFLITIVAFFTALFTNSKVNCVLRGGKLFDFYRQYPQVVKFILKKCTCFSPSLFLIDKFKNEDFKITYLPNPVRLENFNYNRGVIKPYSLLWVRGFDSIYNPEVPIKILATLKGKYPNITLTMIGPDRGLLNSCKILAKELGVSKDVFFIGSVPNNELYTYYQTHEIYLNTTSYESFGVALIEAASCGIPIVSNNVGEIPYLWEDKKNIYTVDNNSIEGYVSCLTLLFEDHSIAKKISEQARENALTFDWQIIKPTWLKVLINE